MCDSLESVESLQEDCSGDCYRDGAGRDCLRMHQQCSVQQYCRRRIDGIDPTLLGLANDFAICQGTSGRVSDEMSAETR